MADKLPCHTCGRASANAARDHRRLCFGCLYLSEPAGAQIVLPGVELPPHPTTHRRRLAAREPREPRASGIEQAPLLPFPETKKIGHVDGRQ